MEHPVHMVQSARRPLVGDGRADRLAADHAGKGQVLHPPFDGAARHVEPLAQHLSPDLARSIDLEVLAGHALDLGAQNLVSLAFCRFRG